MNNKKNTLLKLVSLGIITFVFIMPLVRLFAMSFIEDGNFSFNNYISLLGKTRTIEAIKNTIIVSLSSTALSVTFGTILAYIVAYTDVKRKKLIEILAICPLVIPGYIITLSYSTMFAKKGAVNTFLTGLGLDAINVYSMTGIIIVLAICSMPTVYLMIITSLRKIPRDLEFASMTAGFSVPKTMLTINLKQATTAIIAGGILAFLSSIDNFSVPAFLGTSAGIPVLSTYIYENAISFGPSAFNLAATLSVILAVFAISGTIIQGKIVKAKGKSETISEDYSVRIPLKKSRRTVEYTTIGILALINILPIFTMIRESFQKGYGKTFIENFSLDHYKFVFTNSGVRTAFQNSLTLALSTCAICIVIGTAIAYIKVRFGGKLIAFIETGISSTYAVPGIVLALSMIFHWSTIPNVYGTFKILLISYVTRYLILQIKGSVVAVNSVELSLEEAAISSGNTKFLMWIKVIIPQITKQVISSSFLIFVASLTELSVSSLVAAAGTKTIGLSIFSLQQSGDYSLSIALSSTLVMMIFVAYIIVTLIQKGGKKNELKN